VNAPSNADRINFFTIFSFYFFGPLLGETPLFPGLPLPGAGPAVPPPDIPLILPLTNGVARGFPLLAIVSPIELELVTLPPAPDDFGNLLASLCVKGIYNYILT
jgi:hypothetical protein